MNSRFRKRSDVIQVGTIPLLAVLLVGSFFAGLFPQTAMAQQEKEDLSLRLLSHNYYTEITAGKTKVLLLEVKNIGGKAIHNIELSALQPEGWMVDLEPDRIASLDPEDSIVVKVTVETSPKSAKDSYEIILRADSIAVHRAISAWMTVEAPEGMWLWVGGILAALVVAGFVVIFMRFGRE
jgi:uncharacterized membrane protein